MSILNASLTNKSLSKHQRESISLTAQLMTAGDGCSNFRTTLLTEKHCHK